MAVEDWSTTAGSNTTVGAVPLGENVMAPSDVNNAIREIMGQIATWRDGAIADLGDSADYQPLDATLTDFAALTTAADKGIYADGADSFATYDLTSFGRTLGGLASYAALRTALGAVTVTAVSLAANGYVKFDISGTPFTIQWGTASIAANGSTTVSYSTSYSTFSRAVCSGGRAVTNAEDNNPFVNSTGLTSFSVFSATDVATTIQWIAVGS